MRFGQRVRMPEGCFRIAAHVLAPAETVLVSADGGAPGIRIPPARWARAIWDARSETWVIPAEAGE